MQALSTAVGQKNRRASVTQSCHLLPVRVSQLLHVFCLNLVKSDIQLHSNLKETQMTTKVKPWIRYMLIFVVQSLQYPPRFQNAHCKLYRLSYWARYGPEKAREAGCVKMSSFYRPYWWVVSALMHSITTAGNLNQLTIHQLQSIGKHQQPNQLHHRWNTL